MKAILQHLWSGLSLPLLFFLLTPPGWAQESYVLFGLRHAPLGGAQVRTNDGVLVVMPGIQGGDDADPTVFGVSVELGEADSGIFGHLNTYNSLYGDGNSMTGEVYGQVDGVPGQRIGSLGVVTLGWYGQYDVRADFSPLGASAVTYQVFNGSTLVAAETNATGPIRIETYSEGSPWANPFWRLPDGSVAAIVQLSDRRTIRLPAWIAEESEQSVEGDRIIIRPENVSSVVDFASRVDLTAGGGEDYIVVSQERLGVFNRGHKALGDCLLDAGNGELTVARLNPGNLGDEIGVSIQLDGARQFDVRLQPLDLASNGAALMASAIGSGPSQTGEFLGYAGVQNQDGTLRAFGDFSFLAQGVQISVYRDGSLAGTVLSPGARATVGLSGHPQVNGLGGVADTGPTHAGLSIRLDRLTTFLLPNGSSLEGDQVRFATANSTPLDRLSAFSLTWSNLNAVTLAGETTPQNLSLSDYLPELTARGLLKSFSGADEGESYYLRSTIATNLDGRPGVVVTDRWLQTNVVSATYSLGEDGLRVHGRAEAPFEFFSATGLRTLPEQIALGQTYLSTGTFDAHDPVLGTNSTVEASSLTKVIGLETIQVPAGIFLAVRLETVTTFAGSGSSNLPVACFSTNWLATEVGEVRFAERLVFASGAEEQRHGDLKEFAILTTPARAVTANVGANVVLSAPLLSSPAAGVGGWWKNGVELPETASARLELRNLQSGDAGTYSVLVRLEEEDATFTMTNDVARLRVVPFSDTPPFWATAFGAGWGVNVHASTTDAAGNLYLVGTVNGEIILGPGNTLPSLGREDIFLLKLGSVGQILWARRAGGAWNDCAKGVGVDGAGNVYLTGLVGGSASFGSLRVEPAGLFVAKADPNGNFLWAVSTSGGHGHLLVEGMAVDAAGQQYVLGSFANGIYTFGETNLENLSWNANLFLTKLDAEGQFLWARQFTSQGYCYAGSIALDGPDRLWFTGSFERRMALDGVTLSSGSYCQGGFLARADADGVVLWGKALGRDVQQLALDNTGQLCLSGQFAGTASLDGILLSSRYYEDTFVAKAARDGTLLWARLSPHPPSYRANPMTTDNAGNLYLAGGFYDEVVYGETTFLMRWAGSTVISKLDPNGRLLWNKQVSGTSDNRPQVIAKGDADNVYLAGSFAGQVIFGETNLSPIGPVNGFVLKITGATAPTITQQPQPQTTNLGASVVFTAAAEGTEPLTYQWRKDGVDLEGATGPVFTIAAARWSDRGAYSVVVANAGGIVTSGSAALQVLAPEAGTVAFADASLSIAETNATVLVNVLRTGNLSAVATVDILTSDGTALAGEDYWTTAASLRFAPGETLKTVAVPIVDNAEPETNETFVVRLSHPGAGVVLGKPDTVSITITDNDPPGPPVIRLQPANRVVGQGGSITFHVSVWGATPLSYQWRRGDADIPGATSRWLTISPAQFGDAGVYSVVVRNVVGEVTSSNATLTVLPPPVLLVQPQSQTIPYGEPATFSVLATTSVPDVIRVFGRSSTVPDQESLIIQESGSGTLRIQYDFGAGRDTLMVFSGGYAEERQLIGSLTTNGSGLFTVSFNPPPNGYLAIQISPEDPADSWSYRAECATSPLTYRWYKVDEEIPAWQVGIGPTLSFNPALYCHGGTYFVTASDPAGSVASEVFALNVTGPLLRIVPMVCPGGSNTCVQLWWTVTDYHLEKNEDPEMTEWVDVPDATSGIILPVVESHTLFRLSRTIRPD